MFALFCAVALAGPPQLADARDLMFRERLEEADALAREIRREAPDDLDVFELRSTLLILRIKAGIAETKLDPDKALARTPALRVLVEEFGKEYAEGLTKTRSVLSADPTDERARYVEARLLLNYAWLEKKVLDRWKGLGEFKRGRSIVEGMSREDTPYPRALVALARIEHGVDASGRLAKLFLGGGSRDQGYRLVALALALAKTGTPEEAEAKFVLWDMLSDDKRTREASLLAAELKGRFPENISLARYLKRYPIE